MHTLHAVLTLLLLKVEPMLPLNIEPFVTHHFFCNLLPLENTDFPIQYLQDKFTNQQKITTTVQVINIYIFLCKFDPMINCLTEQEGMKLVKIELNK